MENKKLLESVNSLKAQIEELNKRIKRFKIFSILGFILTIVLFLCAIPFAILAILGKVYPFAILCIVFFVLFMICLQITIAFYYLNKKVLTARMTSYKSVFNVIEQEIKKEKC